MVKKYKEKEGEILLYYIKDLDINTIVENYKKVNFKEEIVESDDYMQQFFNDVTIQRNEYKDNPQNKDEDLLRLKIEFMLHMMAKRCINHKYGYARLNAKVLLNTVGNEYSRIIRTLEEMNIIYIDKTYKVGKSSRAYQLHEKYISKVGRRIETHAEIINFRNKADEELKTEYIKFYEKLKNILGVDLYENYNRVLKNLKLQYPQEAKDYLNSRIYINDYQKIYYQTNIQNYIDKEINNFKIINVDDNKRIYSILTNTPRELKHFLNIKFSVDISNSHPLLINHFIYNKYKFINKDIINYIINNYQYGKEIDPISLINKYIKNTKSAKNEILPKDIIKYIYMTSAGRFWDDFVEIFKLEGIQRQDIKQTLFKEVFYSNTVKTKNKKYTKRFAQVFKKIYPNVFKIINQEKPKDNRAKLSHAMMTLESEIFYKILAKLYKKRGCDVINIHDAIIVLNTDKVNQYEPQDIEKVILSEYKEYNLFPTCSVEFYDPNKWKSQVDINKANERQINDYINTLILSKDKNDMQLLKDINESNVEVSVIDGSITLERSLI